MNKFLEKIVSKNNEKSNKQKIENLVFLVIVLIITIIAMNVILKDKESGDNEESTENSISTKVLAGIEEGSQSDETEESLEAILSTIKGVGKVKVYISYSESSSVIPLYDETTTTSNTEEGDSSGGTRNVIETETQKEIVFSESSGEKQPVTQKTTNPVVKGAIITAEGASDATIKTNIINAVEAATGLTIEKIQVFEMN